MFYSQFILAKKGPLGTIWIAAHLERKLRKNQVADTDIGHSVDSILFPDMPIALRLSSHLLLGVVRIYSRKVNYLFDDCSEALLKVKQAFRSTCVDLPPEESTAPYHSITLPETFDLDDFELPDNDLFQGNFVDHHVSTREQITLQDTMDSTVFSTSQFGLDERFGDGDASQIGLDLEEELFSVKAVAPEQVANLDAGPQASTQPMAQIKDGKDIRDVIETSEQMLNHDINKIGNLASNTEYMDYAQTPYTPGVVDDPTGEDFPCNSHLGQEDQVFKDSLNIENVENVSGKLDFDQVDKVAGSVPHHHDMILDQNSASQDTAQNIDENGHVSHNLENTQNVEQLSDTGSLAGNNSIKGLPDGVINNEIIMCASETGTAEIQSEPCLDQSCQLGPSCYPKDDQSSGQPEGPQDAEAVANADLLCEPRRLSATDDTFALGSSYQPELAGDAQSYQDLNIVKSSNNVDQVVGNPSVSMQLLQPCNSHPNEHVVSSDGVTTLEDGQGIDSQAAETMKPAMQETHLVEPTLSELLPDNISFEEVDNAVSRDDQSSRLNTSGLAEVPAPEILLRAPEVAGKPNDLPAFTPNKEDPAGGNADNSTSTQITGKKRSFTESTLTVQSINSEESFRDSRSKRSVESIPYDDDVLSSILVGRRSSGLKMKPTPSTPEVPFAKCLKTAERPSTIKRKVLMDDAMVLHGDTIRQQLVSTEDIRRIRKKAPCTRPEILLIQRQLLEDGMLNETIFSGISVELNCMHCEAYDLSRIRVCENENALNSSELKKTVESSAPVGTENEGRIEVPTLGNNMEVQSAVMSIQNENCKDKDQVMDSHDINATMETTEVENSHNLVLDGAVDMEVERVSIAVVTEEHSALHGLDSSFTLHPVSGENTTEEYLGLGLTGTECVSTNVNEHASVVDTASEKVYDTIDSSLDNVSCQVAGGPENVTGKAIDMDDNKHGLSIGVRTEGQKDASPLGMMTNSDTVAPPETENCDKLVTEISDQIVDEPGHKGLDNGNEDALPVEFPFEDKSPSSSLICGQEPNTDSHVKNGECQAFDEADVHNGMYAECVVINQPVGECHHDLENIRVENDTDFLNEDDADIAEEGDGDLHTSEEFENSGWSARTRAVAKYLQNSFDKEALHGSKVLFVDKLLSGKTRKEASRMFFETLVLKTKDYIHVEQAKPLDNIILKPRLKLMKSEF